MQTKQISHTFSEEYITVHRQAFSERFGKSWHEISETETRALNSFPLYSFCGNQDTHLSASWRHLAAYSWSRIPQNETGQRIPPCPRITKSADLRGVVSAKSVLNCQFYTL